MIAEDKSSLCLGDALLQHFPEVDASFAYGSGVFKQEGYDYEDDQKADYSKLPMLDMVLCVRDPVAWHRQNLEQNGAHYSSLKFLGPAVIAKLQEDYGAGIYYNTSVPVPDAIQKGRMMKYGVISYAALKEDLTEWTWLYTAGRMQKPVQVIRMHDSLREAAHSNLLSAARVSLLLLPETFTDMEFFVMIAGLSYRGDFRMTFGENPQKVRNIVSGNVDRFHRLYDEVVRSLPTMTAVTHDNTRFQQDISPAARAKAIQLLPLALRRQLYRQPRQWESMPVSTSRGLVKLGIHSIVARSSLTQSFKGIFTAGVFNAMWYALKKVDKMRKGMQQQMQ